MKVTKDTLLIYIFEGEPQVGSLADWAKAREQSHYSSFDVSTDVWVVNDVAMVPPGPTFLKLTPEMVEASKTDNDYSYADYKLGEQTATVRIDLRA